MSIASVMPSSHIILWCPFLLLPSIFPSVREFSSKSAVHIRWPKYWSFSFSISLSNEYSGLISLKIDWFDLLNYPRDSQESSPAPHSIAAAAAAAKSLQSCPTLRNPIDGSPPGSAVPEILQARTLEWVAISSSNAWKWKVKGKWLSRVWLFATPWTADYQAPPSMGFSRQEYWSGVPLPSTHTALTLSKFKSLRVLHGTLHVSSPFHSLHIITVYAAAKSHQSCLTLCDPIDGSPPGSPSLGFSRQKHWSGLPFPSPMHESEKWKGIRSVMSDS